ncbi:HNH endonuclease [Actinoplanes sp. NPDC048988]|uniref:HNH endonuclease n=1 Tax=Actinoplanes sp. NPDC048988 TaxID=3363901 RepID=UPI0037125470
MNRPIHERILERCAIFHPLDGGCVYWTGAATKNGYGVIRHQGKAEYVHRLMAAYYGMNVEGKTVDHLCHERRCVRMEHLSVCSREENSWRENSKMWRAFFRYILTEESRREAEQRAAGAGVAA